jgi:hypothetical protein
MAGRSSAWAMRWVKPAGAMAGGESGAVLCEAAGGFDGKEADTGVRFD